MGNAFRFAYMLPEKVRVAWSKMELNTVVGYFLIFDCGCPYWVDGASLSQLKKLRFFLRIGTFNKLTYDDCDD